MKIILTTVVLLWISYSSIGQSNTTEFEPSSVSINNTPQKNNHSYTNGLIDSQEIAPTYAKTTNTQPVNINQYRIKEWRKIKKKILNNKKRLLNNKERIYTSKILDTVYLNIPYHSKESYLSSW
ncbi:hypothetical protein [Aquimarina longa]|uniref:hypothetical protein n=1 Tax=Aquimarina longa TaxID=1080221 RepID=UPI0011E03BE5|nr:hypothetical protein [Aquimarina longa]